MEKEDKFLQSIFNSLWMSMLFGLTENFQSIGEDYFISLCSKQSIHQQFLIGNVVSQDLSEEYEMKSKTKQRYNRIAGLYDILEAPMEHIFSNWRKELLKEASGKTLEVGIGTGQNIEHYPAEVELTGIDFSEKMIEKARNRTRHHPNVRLLLMDAENMSFNNNTFDTVVTSCVFCSVPDPVQGLKEIKRVCKSGGKILMLEHVRSEKKIIGNLMDIINPVPLTIIGANINRRTYDNLLKAGFIPEQIQVQNLWSDIMKLIRITND